MAGLIIVCLTESNVFILKATHISTSVPQGSVLGPLLFVIYVDTLDRNVSNVKFNFMSYTAAAPPLLRPLASYNSLLIELKLLLNAAKTKLIIFSRKKEST